MVVVVVIIICFPSQKFLTSEEEKRPTVFAFRKFPDKQQQKKVIFSPQIMLDDCEIMPVACNTKWVKNYTIKYSYARYGHLSTYV